MVTKKYTEDDIEVLSDRDHVRKRLPVYAGNTSTIEHVLPIFSEDGFYMTTVSFVPAALKCVGEIIDNSIDEFAQVKTRNKTLKIEAEPTSGTYKISDNGRGVPIGKHKTGKHTPEVVFGSLRSGRNFKDDKQVGVIGQNGMGSSITCFCSSSFIVEIKRDKKKYKQTFSDGALKITKPSVRSLASTVTGTSISFQLDPSVFGNVTIPDEMMETRAVELALTNPGITVDYNGKKHKFRKGFDDVISKISTNYFKFADDNVEFYVIFDLHEGVDEKFFTWVNSSLLYDGGICNSQFANAFNDRVTKQLESAASKGKCEVTKNDIRRNLLIIGNLKISDPEYDAQSKVRLIGPNLRKEMRALVDAQWRSFQRKHKDWLDEVLEQAMMRHHSSANKKAIQDHKKNIKKKVPGLIDATSPKRHLCQILLTEGDSASSMITDARNPETTATLPLRGKINNVYKSTFAQALDMGKVAGLISAIGLVPGKRVIRSLLRYGKIIVATDADHDGDDIFTLLINLFYRFWPELLDPDKPPIIFRLVAPNVVVSKGNKRIHFSTTADYEKSKNKYKGWSVEYMKGLGSLHREDWDKMLSGGVDTLIPIVDDGSMDVTLELLFGGDAEARKEWLR